MKKYIFALICALCLITLPQNVNATTQTGPADNCVITVASNEKYTINEKTDCRIENNGTLTVQSGTYIKKMAHDDNGVINNHGTVNIYGGYLEAYYGMTIVNWGTVNVYGGTLYAPLHQAVWGKPGSSTNIYGGDLITALGNEQAIYTRGSLTICGGKFNTTVRSNLSEAVVTEKCQKSEPAQPTTPTTNTQPATSQSTSQSTATTKKQTAQANTIATTETKTEPKEEPVTQSETIAISTPSTKTETKNDEVQTETDAENLPEAGASEAENRVIPILIATAIAVIGGASAAILLTKLRH